MADRVVGFGLVGGGLMGREFASAAARWAHLEPLVFEPGERGYGSDGDPEKIVPLVRQAVELGADVIKADFTDDVADYSRVIEAAAPRPVLVRGGGRASEEEVLAKTREVMRLGAAGIVFGRNVIQHADPAGITRRLMAIVHG